MYSLETLEARITIYYYSRELYETARSIFPDVKERGPDFANGAQYIRQG
jgi:hypothetical protein